jgi:hypothetical protein
MFVPEVRETVCRPWMSRLSPLAVVVVSRERVPGETVRLP